MKVREFIEALQKFDQELEVYSYNDGIPMPADPPEIDNDGLTDVVMVW